MAEDNIKSSFSGARNRTVSLLAAGHRINFIQCPGCGREGHFHVDGRPDVCLAVVDDRVTAYRVIAALVEFGAPNGDRLRDEVQASSEWLPERMEGAGIRHERDAELPVLVIAVRRGDSAPPPRSGVRRLVRAILGGWTNSPGGNSVS